MKVSQITRLSITLLLMGSFLLTGCIRQSRDQSDTRETVDSTGVYKGEFSTLAQNASQYGVRYPETFVLMQNRMGMRIEYCVDRSDLQLWISPQAWKSLDYKDRNFSNRDDHCNIFEEIKLPHLKFEQFDSCDYDPFHSKLYYGDQTLHIANIFDKPMVVVWFENASVVDFESHHEDQPISRVNNEFIVQHEDRGKVFDYAAVMAEGEGHFRHQGVLDEGRSIYARAQLGGGQHLVIASELKKENVPEMAREYAQKDIRTILSTNEDKVQQALQNGRFQLRNRPEMQKLLEKNRRIALSMQDGGFMRSTNQYIYYLLWFRDGGMNTSHIAYSGWPKPAADHSEIALVNPNVSKREPKGKFFGQLMSGPITKWEEDGLFFVVWPAFAHWTQTGDKTYIQGQYLDNMEQGMDWLERRCYDKEKGLFGRYHYSETPLYGSRGYGYDRATGRPTDKFPSVYQGDTIVKSYDIYINMLTYSTYLMMSAMETAVNKEEKADTYYNKAMELKSNMEQFFEVDSRLPSYGDLITKKGETVQAEPYGMDPTDYRWSLSIPPFNPTYPDQYKTYRTNLWRDMTQKPQGIFICTYNSILTSMDPLLHDEDSIMAALDYLVPQSVEPGKYLPMPYTIPEMIDVKDGDPFHDIRPLVYSIAPWLSAVTNFGMHRLPFGIAIRPTKYLNNLNNYRYKGALLDVTYEGKGSISQIIFNGEPLNHTWQIPENALKKGENEIEVSMKDNPKNNNLWAKSTVMLKNVSEDAGDINFQVKTYGENVATFKNLEKEVVIRNESGENMEFDRKTMNELTFIEFEGRGNYTITLQ